MSVITKEFRHGGRGSKSYDEADVDDFLDTVASAMTQGQALPSCNVTFESPRFLRRGYDAAHVDEYLQELARLSPPNSPAAPASVLASSSGSASDGHQWSAEQRSLVLDQVFESALRRGRGYDEIEVDDFLDHVVAAMDRHVPLPDLNVTFREPKGLGRRGYDADQVDAFLDRIAAMVPGA